jgi:soluble lytic murein transglycosylase-like protein
MTTNNELNDQAEPINQVNEEKEVKPDIVFEQKTMKLKDIKNLSLYDLQTKAEKYSIEAKAIGQYLAHVMVVAREVNLDPLLLFAVMAIESNFNPLAQSPAGAQGLMQVLTRLHEEKFVPYGGPGAAFKPEANIRVGAYILKHFIAISGSIHGGLRHYVGGAVIGDGGYVGKVLREREQLITLLSEKASLSDNSANLKQTISR